MSKRTERLLLGAILSLGVALRLVGVDDPIATRWDLSWREADVGAMARAFHREGMDPLHPRIAWRGDGPGYVESEFPAVPWLIAAAWHVTGESALAARLVAAAIGIAALLVFAGLARRTLPPLGALAATAVVAVNPLFVSLGASLQPDPLMLLFALLSFAALERWYARDDDGPPWAAAGWLALAILAKASAVHLGVVLAAAILRRRGLRALTDRRVWLAGAVALAPGIAWYAWAGHLWTTWGNSLGVSNQDHWIGLDIFTNARFAAGFLHHQVVDVFSFGGLALAAVALLRRPRPAVVWLAAWWLLGALAFLLVTIRSTSGDWAFYYHAMTVPPAALLVGHGFEAVSRFRPPARTWRHLRWAGLLTAAVGVAIVLTTAGHVRVLAAGLTTVAVLGAAFSYAARPVDGGGAGRATAARTLVAAALPFLLAATLGHLAAVSIKHAAVRDPDGRLARARTCTRLLARRVPQDALIVGTGGDRIDENGSEAAFDRSMVFFYTERFGFTFPSDTADLRATLRSLQRRGGRYWFPRHRDLGGAPSLLADLVRAGAVLDSCDTHALVDLDRAFLAEPAGPPRDRSASLAPTGAPSRH